MVVPSRLALAVVLTAALVSVACEHASDDTAVSTGSPDSVISTVRNGVLEQYNTTTVGKAFEGTFPNGQWSSGETAKGATVVEFNGTIRVDALFKGEFLPNLRENCITSLGLSDAVKQADEQYDNSTQEWRDYHGQVDSPDYDAIRQKIQDADAERTLINAKITECGKTISVIPVKFQFVLSADKKTFKVGYIDENVFGAVSKDRVLSFVYQ
jgi:hypothetical protein